MSEPVVDGARVTGRVTERIECGQYGCRKAMELLADAMPDIGATLEQRGIPARALAEDRAAMDIGIDDASGLAVEIAEPADGSRGLSLEIEPTDNRVGATARLESREEFERRRAKQQALYDVENERVKKAHATAHARWRKEEHRYRREVAFLEQEWEAEAGTRRAAVVTKRIFLLVMGPILIGIGFTAARVIYVVWNLPGYYRAIKEEEYRVGLVTLFAMCMPWIVIALPVILCALIARALSRVAWDVEEPPLELPRGPKEPPKPELKAVPGREPLDVLDSHDRVREYAIEVVTEKVREALQLKILPRSMRR